MTEQQHTQPSAQQTQPAESTFAPLTRQQAIDLLARAQKAQGAPLTKEQAAQVLEKARAALLSPAELPATAPPDQAAARRRRAQMWDILGFFIKLAVVLLIGWVLCTQVFGFAVMNGESMYPRLRDGDLLLFYRLQDEWHIGDVVVHTANGQQYVGRVVASAGDTVEVTPEGQLLVNGNVQSEEIFYPTTPQSAAIEYPYTVPADSLFLLSDFRTNGTDSRSYGAVPAQDLSGKVISFLRRRGI